MDASEWKQDMEESHCLSRQKVLACGAEAGESPGVPLSSAGCQLTCLSGPSTGGMGEGGL